MNADAIRFDAAWFAEERPNENILAQFTADWGFVVVAQDILPGHTKLYEIVARAAPLVNYAIAGARSS